MTKTNKAYIDAIGKIDPRSRPIYGHVRTLQEPCACDSPRENHFGYVYERGDAQRHYPQVKVTKGEDDGEAAEAVRG